MGEAAPNPKASARNKKGDSASSTTLPTPTPKTTAESAPRLSASAKELSWKSSDDEEVGSQEEGNESNNDSNDGSDKDSEETVKSGAGK
nr:hypothetical protein [Tanacetum cinerariifolium]